MKSIYPTSYLSRLPRIAPSLLLGVLTSLVSVQSIRAETPPPNIIIFYVDDLGWQDVQINDLGKPCPYETPNIIKLAKAGINFPQGYSPAPTCAPSRAGIITGQHPAKIGMTHVTLGNLRSSKKSEAMAPPYLQYPLDLKLLTLADAMKANGYKTGHSGKWHVGLNAASYGFDVVNEDRGLHRGMEDRTKDFATSTDKKYPLSKEKYAPYSDKKPEGISYPYDEVTESALQFMAESGDQPFFLNLCHWMVHWPVLTRNGELLEYYCDKLGHEFPQKPGDWTLPGQQNPYFASMVTTVDWSLGRVVDFLKKTEDPRQPGKKLIDTTYIFFTSDNGGAESRGPEIVSDNAPLKYGKGYAEEGGVRVPMIIAGPEIKPGSEFEGLVNQLDYFPTILGLTQSSIAEADEKELSGLDISPVLTGASKQILDAAGQERDHLFWHFPHNSKTVSGGKSAIRSGDFKLYKHYEKNEYELYQLYKDGQGNDLEEVNNLANNPKYQSVVEKLSATLDTDLAANNAEGPYLNPDYKGHKALRAKLSESKFDQANRQATISVDASGPKVKQAHVIYRPSDSKTKHKRSRKMVSEPENVTLPGMRASAEISKDGYTILAKIPENISAYCFVLIDENGYQHYSKDVKAK